MDMEAKVVWERVRDAEGGVGRLGKSQGWQGGVGGRIGSRIVTVEI